MKTHDRIRELEDYLHNVKRSMGLPTVLFCAAALYVPPTRATTWPQRSVRFSLALGRGSGVDINAPLFADRLSARWGQPVVVENRPGGDGMIAIGAVIAAGGGH